MLPELTTDELAAALDAVADGVLARLDAAEPPIDALELARALQLSVAWDERQSGRGRVVRLREFAGTASRGSILLRPDPRPERLQWVIAHEIGELFAVHVFERLGVDPCEAPSGSREMVANQLAGRMLLPYGWFSESGAGCGWDLPELKARFSTASQTFLRRSASRSSTMAGVRFVAETCPEGCRRWRRSSKRHGARCTRQGKPSPRRTPFAESRPGRSTSRTGSGKSCAPSGTAKTARRLIGLATD